MDYEYIVGMLDKTFAWSVTRTFSREEAEELTQEIMFQAVKSISEIVCNIPLFTKDQFDLFVSSAKTIFADFLSFYSEEVKKYLDG